MKQFFTFLFLFTCIHLSRAQNDKSLFIGEWKVISIETNDIYYNSKTDSIKVSKEFKKIFSDSLKLDNVLKVTKMTYSDNIYSFREDNTYSQNAKSNPEIKGTYLIKPEKNLIDLIINEDGILTMKYEFITNQLRLSLFRFDKRTTLFVLEKENQ